MHQGEIDKKKVNPVHSAGLTNVCANSINCFSPILIERPIIRLAIINVDFGSYSSILWLFFLRYQTKYLTYNSQHQFNTYMCKFIPMLDAL